MNDMQKVVAGMLDLAVRLDNVSFDLNYGLFGEYAEELRRMASRLEAEQTREPVAEIIEITDGLGTTLIQWNVDRSAISVGTKLYTHPPADAGMVMVPKEATRNMIAAGLRYANATLDGADVVAIYNGMIAAAKGE